MSKSLNKIIKGAIILSLIFVVGSIFAPNVSAFTAWSKNSKGQFVNDKGKVIPGATMKGIDVSKWQGNIDWKKVSKTDVDFAIIRCGFGDNITSQDDECWERNVRGCIKYNIPFSTYLYSYALNKAQAKSEADHVIRLLEGKNISFPVYYDMEDKTQQVLGKKKIGNIANVFLNEVRSKGYVTGVYANLNWWNNFLPASMAKDIKVSKWVAQWDSTCTYKGSYNMWQCASDGKVKGISGRVDINFWFGDYNPNWYRRQYPSTKITKQKRPGRVKIKSVKAGHRKLKVKWKKVKGAVGYKVRYSTKKSLKKYKTKFVKGKSTTLKKLKRNKRYYIKVRAFKTQTNGKRLYSKKWSKRVSKKTKKW